MRVTCTLGRDDALTLEYRAVSDAPTVVNLTNHAYWNLDGEGSGDVLGHHLRVEAARWTPVDSALIRGDRTGRWTAPRSICADPAASRRPSPRRTDNSAWAVAGSTTTGCSPTRLPPTRAPPPSCTRPSPAGCMEVRTTEPGIQVYTGNLLDGGITGKSGRPYGPHAGVALETQHFPDSPNRPDDPSTLLRPGEVHRSTTVLGFSVTEE